MITVDTLKLCKLVLAARGHGDAMFFHLYRAIEYPRLTRFDHYSKKTKTVKSTFRVDGQECRDLADAAEKLNHPPVITLDEQALLLEVPTEWTRLEEGRGNAAARWHGLQEKGLIQWKDGLVRRTPA